MPDRAGAVHGKDSHGGTTPHGKELHGNTPSSSDLAAKIASGSEEKSIEVNDSKSRVTMQNTYRLESRAPFDRDRVGVVLEQVMQEMLSSAQYDATASGKLAEQVSTEILACVKEMNFERYRYIVVVSIYEKMFQGITSKCNALWDNQRDDCVSYTFSNSSMIAVGVVYGIYYE